MRHHSDPIDDLGRLDPIDGARLAATWSDSDAKQALLKEITTMPVHTPKPVTAAAAGRTPRRTLKLAAGFALAAAVLVVAQGILFNGAPAFAVRELPNGVIEIDGSAQFRDGAALAAELREFGIEVEIITVVSSPSAVGTVTVWDQPGGGAEITEDYKPEGISYGADGSGDAFNITIDPSVFTDQITIQIQVQADEGERYVIAEEVFEPGEVVGGLHCALGEPLRVETLIPYLSDLGIDPIWSVASPTDDPFSLYEEEVGYVPEGQVLWGYAQDASTVRFTVVPDGVTLSENYPARLSDMPCTPEQAAAWN